LHVCAKPWHRAPPFLREQLGKSIRIAGIAAETARVIDQLTVVVTT